VEPNLTKTKILAIPEPQDQLKEFLERIWKRQPQRTMEFYDGDLKDIWDSDLDPVSVQITAPKQRGE